MKISKIIAVFIPILLNLFCTGAVRAQKNRCSCCYEVEKEKRKDIVGEKLGQIPYSGVVSVFSLRHKFRGTAAFIGNNTLLTVRHNLLDGKKKPGTLFLHVNSPLGSELIVLRKKDYTVFYRSGTEMEDDIAVVKVTNQRKTEHLGNFNFTVENFENIKSSIKDTIFISGFPCDKEIEKSNKKMVGDTLTDKYITPIETISFNAHRTIMSFNTCVCFGDSGAPLWVRIDNNIYIIGVCKGHSNFLDSKKITNIAVMLTQQKIDWINSVLRE